MIAPPSRLAAQPVHDGAWPLLNMELPSLSSHANMLGQNQRGGGGGGGVEPLHGGSVQNGRQDWNQMQKPLGGYSRQQQDWNQVRGNKKEGWNAEPQGPNIQSRFAPPGSSHRTLLSPPGIEMLRPAQFPPLNPGAAQVEVPGMWNSSKMNPGVYPGSNHHHGDMGMGFNHPRAYAGRIGGSAYEVNSRAIDNELLLVQTSHPLMQAVNQPRPSVNMPRLPVQGAGFSRPPMQGAYLLQTPPLANSVHAGVLESEHVGRSMSGGNGERVGLGREGLLEQMLHGDIPYHGSHSHSSTQVSRSNSSGAYSASPSLSHTHSPGMSHSYSGPALLSSGAEVVTHSHSPGEMPRSHSSGQSQSPADMFHSHSTGTTPQPHPINSVSSTTIASHSTESMSHSHSISTTLHSHSHSAGLADAARRHDLRHKLILLRGLPGSGKTTLAKYVCVHVCWWYICACVALHTCMCTCSIVCV